MSKDSYWFKHDASVGRDIRMRKMAHVYSHWGKGIYWDVIEILREQNGYTFECDETSLQMLADLIGCKDDEKFINWYRDCIKFGLFDHDENTFWSPVLTKNMEIWEIKKLNGGKGGRPKKTEIKPKPKPKRNLTDNLNETIREEKRREEVYSFDSFWSDYDKKVGKKEKIKSKFKNLSDENKLKIKQHLPKYKLSQPEKRFRKNPETYLNNNSWDDEIIAEGRDIINSNNPILSNPYKDISVEQAKKENELYLKNRKDRGL